MGFLDNPPTKKELEELEELKKTKNYKVFVQAVKKMISIAHSDEKHLHIDLVTGEVKNPFVKEHNSLSDIYRELVSAGLKHHDISELTMRQIQLYYLSSLKEKTRVLAVDQKKEIKKIETSRVKKDKKVKKRKSQLHALILKVIKKLVKGSKPPATIDFWQELENHQDEYDNEGIIQVIEEDTIKWMSKGGVEQNLTFNSFRSLISKLKKEVSKT